MEASSYDHDQSVTAFFDTRAAAEKAKADVVAAGVPLGMVTIVEGKSATTSTAATQTHGSGFWDAVKELFAPEEDKHAYAEGLSRGGFLLTAHTSSAHYHQVLEILDHEGAVDMDERESEWKKEGWSGYHGATPAVGASTAASLGTEAPLAATTGAVAGRGLGSAGEETIQLAEETLRVGKRDVNHGRVRLRSYVVEKPVQESVSLHSEKVDVTRRPVGATTVAGEELFKERTISAEEHSEEAIVQKEAHVYEEVSLGKTVHDRTQEIKDTVRKTEVEIDDGRKTGVGMATGAMATDYATTIVPHMEVRDSSGAKVGTVDHYDGGDSMKLAKHDSPDGMHHFIPTSWIARVDEHVHLSKSGTDVKSGWTAA